MADTLLASITASALNPALALLPPKMDTQAARVLLLTIGLQESRMKDRAQVLDGGGRGAARGLLQFEQGGGVRGVLRHPASKALAIEVCKARGARPVQQDVWERMEFDDILCFAFGRLLVYTDAAPLPGARDTVSAWKLYAERTWNPGKPKPETWPEFHFRAQDFVLGAST